MASGPSAAFFDLDRTLISGSRRSCSASPRGVPVGAARSVRKGRVGAVAFGSGRQRRHVDRRARPHPRRCEGRARRRSRRPQRRIVPKLIAKVRPEAQALVDRHRHAGRATYIVSARRSTRRTVGQSAGDDGGIGTISEIADGVYTGDLAGPFCYGPGKVEAIADLAMGEPRSRPVLRLQRLGQ